eukprot:7386417-Prymnesium_polylepis.1
MSGASASTDPPAECLTISSTASKEMPPDMVLRAAAQDGEEALATTDLGSRSDRNAGAGPPLSTRCHCA